MEKVTVSIERFEDLLACKFKLEAMEEAFNALKADKLQAETDKFQAEEECKKYKELYEAAIKK